MQGPQERGGFSVRTPVTRRPCLLAEVLSWDPRGALPFGPSWFPVSWFPALVLLLLMISQKDRGAFYLFVGKPACFSLASFFPCSSVLFLFVCFYLFLLNAEKAGGEREQANNEDNVSPNQESLSISTPVSSAPAIANAPNHIHTADPLKGSSGAEGTGLWLHPPGIQCGSTSSAVTLGKWPSLSEYSVSSSVKWAWPLPISILM